MRPRWGGVYGFEGIQLTPKNDSIRHFELKNDSLCGDYPEKRLFLWCVVWAYVRRQCSTNQLLTLGQKLVIEQFGDIICNGWANFRFRGGLLTCSRVDPGCVPIFLVRSIRRSRGFRKISIAETAITVTAGQSKVSITQFLSLKCLTVSVIKL